MSVDDRPLVSVITAVRNGARTISLTLDSVLSQRGVDVEHIIIDGLSTDGTTDVVRQYQNNRVRLLSESDQGIYDAMNKGVYIARGEWLLFLGADDMLASKSVLADILLDRELSVYDVVCGRSCYQGGACCVPKLDWRTYVFNTIQHQSAIYRRRLFDDFRYREDIPVVADYEINFLMHLQRRNILFLRDNVAICGARGVSHTSSQIATLIDMFKIRGRYVNPFFNIILLSVGFANLAVTSLIRHEHRR